MHIRFSSFVTFSEVLVHERLRDSESPPLLGIALKLRETDAVEETFV
jgi:hypothetical protein